MLELPKQSCTAELKEQAVQRIKEAKASARRLGKASSWSQARRGR